MKKPYAILAGVLTLGAATLVAQQPLGEKLSNLFQDKQEQVNNQNDQNNQKENKRVRRQKAKSNKALPTIQGVNIIKPSSLDMIAEEGQQLTKTITLENEQTETVDYTAYLTTELTPTFCGDSHTSCTDLSACDGTYIYSYESNNNHYVVYDMDWNVVTNKYYEDVTIFNPYGMTIIDGKLWIVDSQKRAKEYDSSLVATGRGFEIEASSIQVGSMGNRLLIADQEAEVFKVYNTDGTLYKTIKADYIFYNVDQVIFNEEENIVYLSNCNNYIDAYKYDGEQFRYLGYIEYNTDFSAMFQNEGVYYAFEYNTGKIMKLDTDFFNMIRCNKYSMESGQSAQIVLKYTPTTGRYIETELYIKSGESSIHYDFTCALGGNPSFKADKVSIDFGKVIEGTIAYNQVTIENTGKARLFLEDFKCDNENVYIAKNTELSTEDIFVFDIRYAPKASDEVLDDNVSITMETASGSETMDIALSGQGIVSPAISVNKTEITIEDPVNCGDDIEISFDITNSTSTPLEYIVSDGPGKKALVITDGVDMSNEGSNTIQAIKDYYPVFSYTTFSNGTEASIKEALKTCGVVLIPEIENNTNAYSTYAPALQSFVNGGGIAVICGCYSTSNLNSTGLLNATNYNNTYGKTVGVTNKNRLTEGIESYSLSNASYIITDETLTADITYNDYIVVGHKTMGIGEVVYIANDFYEYNESNARVIANAVRSRGGQVASGSVPEGTATVNAVINTDNLPAGENTVRIAIRSNDTGTPGIEIPVTFTLQSKPKAAVEETTLDFGAETIGSTFDNLTATICNVGCDELTISGHEMSNEAFTASGIPSSIDAGAIVEIEIAFAPTATGDYNGKLNISTDGGDIEISLTGKVTPAPEIAIEKTSYTISGTLSCENNTGSATISITNKGEATGQVRRICSAEEIVNIELSSLKSLIPNFHSIEMDGHKNYIDDGGNDMYDGGNYLSTDIASYFNYTNGTIVSGGPMGANGKYVTKADDGLFMMAAELDGVKEFSITGNLGADGDGQHEGFEYDFGDYKAFCTRTIGTYDPSINHIILVPSDDNVTHTFLTSTEDENHIIKGLDNTTSIVYLLFSSENDASEETIKSVAQALAKQLPEQGASLVIPQGETSELTITFDASKYTPGNHSIVIPLETNDPLNRRIDVTVNFTTEGTSSATISEETVAFGNVETRKTAMRKLTISNTGCSPLIITGTETTGDMGDEIDVLGEMPSKIEEGNSEDFYLAFSTSTAGDYSGTLTIKTSGGDLTVSASGSGIAAPSASVAKTTSEVTATCGDETKVSYSMSNSSAATLDYAVYDESEKALVINYGAPSYYVSNLTTAIRKYVPHFNYETFDASAPEALSTALEGKRVVIIPSITDSYSSTYYAYSKALQSFVNNGGHVIICGTYYYSTINATGLLSVTDNRSYNNNETVYDYTENTYTSNVPYITMTESTYAIDEPTLTADITYNGHIVVGHKSYGKGEVEYIGFNYNYYYNAQCQLIANAINRCYGTPIASGSIAKDENKEIELTIPEDVVAVDRSKTFYMVTNDPTQRAITLTANWTVEDGDAVADPSAKTFTFSANKGERDTKVLTIGNTGCDELTISGISDKSEGFDDVFTLSSVPSEIAVNSSEDIQISYCPAAEGANEGSFTINTNAGDIVVTLNGQCTVPAATIENTTINVSKTLGCGDTEATGSITIKNDGNGPLTLSKKSVEELATADYSTIASVIPNQYAFVLDGGSNYIQDGGNSCDMYDYGNYLNTNLKSKFNYTNGAIVSGGAMGANGRYFTSFNNGIFVMGAELDGVTEFSITGELGADGNGTRSGFELNAGNYKAFCTILNNTGDPSVNHIIIVPNDEAVTHEFSSNTNVDNHYVRGLDNVNELYYILFAIKRNESTTQEIVENIVNEFINNTLIVPYETIEAGETKEIELSVTIVGMPEGDHTNTITLMTNDTDNPSVDVTLNYTIDYSNSAAAEATISEVTFPGIKASRSSYKNFSITNTGCEDITLKEPVSTDEVFEVELSDVDLPVGATVSGTIYFKPEEEGDYSGTVTIGSDKESIAFTIDVEGACIGSKMIAAYATTPSGTYTAGDVIEIEIAFNDNVTLYKENEDVEMPYLKLNTGGIAEYVSSEANILRFTYTVGEEDNVEALEFDCEKILGGCKFMNMSDEEIDVTLCNKLADNSTIRLYNEIPNAIADITSDDIKVAIAVYPNPATDYIVVELSNEVSGTIEIYSINGSMVIADKYVGKQKTVNVSGLTSGMYIVRVVTAEKMYVKQWIKK
ncbi:MAG: choice-of-anchor D domain-containing protein [Bacteroidales bacterium]|nr:choice-of-anchor D domain-containing protein [Bacteroidales bacterium]